MDVHLYFSLIPEALIASNLPPEKFGQYYATGHKYKSKGQAIFFEVDPTFRHDFFALEEGIKLCAPHPDGTPKNSVYISVYRVLEHIPTSALGTLYLSTAYGHTLGLERDALAPAEAPGLHPLPDAMLHHLYGRDSERVVYGGFWRESTRAVLRYQGQA